MKKICTIVDFYMINSKSIQITYCVQNMTWALKYQEHRIRSWKSCVCLIQLMQSDLWTLPGWWSTHGSDLNCSNFLKNENIFFILLFSHKCNVDFFLTWCHFFTWHVYLSVTCANYSVMMISLICRKENSGGNMERISGDRFLPYH